MRKGTVKYTEFLTGLQPRIDALPDGVVKAFVDTIQSIPKDELPSYQKVLLILQALEDEADFNFSTFRAQFCTRFHMTSSSFDTSVGETHKALLKHGVLVPDTLRRRIGLYDRAALEAVLPAISDEGALEALSRGLEIIGKNPHEVQVVNFHRLTILAKTELLPQDKRMTVAQIAAELGGRFNERELNAAVSRLRRPLGLNGMTVNAPSIDTFAKAVAASPVPLYEDADVSDEPDGVLPPLPQTAADKDLSNGPEEPESEALSGLGALDADYENSENLTYFSVQIKITKPHAFITSPGTLKRELRDSMPDGVSLHIEDRLDQEDPMLILRFEIDSYDSMALLRIIKSRCGLNLQREHYKIHEDDSITPADTAEYFNNAGKDLLDGSSRRPNSYRQGSLRAVLQEHAQEVLEDPDSATPYALVVAARTFAGTQEVGNRKFQGVPARLKRRYPHAGDFLTRERG